MSIISDNYEEIKKDLAGFKGRLLAVTKYVGIDEMVEAYQLGIRDFAENKVQDALEKLNKLPTDVVENSTWHFIGHLQSNKVRKVVGRFDYIHSVDSYELAKKISEVAKEKNINQKILLEVNISQENTKFGFNEKKLDKVLKSLLQLDNISLTGLMTIAPNTPNKVFLKKIFTDLKVLMYNIQVKCNIELKELSMGMSSDYKEAMEAGSTMVRLGRRLFR